MDGGGRVVLLVLQNPEAGREWADSLRRNGLAVLTASPRGAQHGCQRDLADLIVINVPCAAGGLELCRRLRAKTTNPILMLDSCADEAQSLEAYAAGADECVSGLVSAAVFVAKVLAWLRFCAARPLDSQPTLEVPGLCLLPALR